MGIDNFGEGSYRSDKHTRKGPSPQVQALMLCFSFLLFLYLTISFSASVSVFVVWFVIYCSSRV